MAPQTSPPPLQRISSRRRVPTLAVTCMVVASLVAASGCDYKAEPNDGDGHHHHHHVAPHGGTLVVLGDESAHLELVLEPDGELTVYLLDGEAEKPVRTDQTSIEIEITPKSTDTIRAKFTETLAAVASPLTGETVGDSSEFRLKSEKLVGWESFDCRIKAVRLRGQALEDIRFPFPEGNDHHDH